MNFSLFLGMALQLSRVTGELVIMMRLLSIATRRLQLVHAYLRSSFSFLPLDVSLVGYLYVALDVGFADGVVFPEVSRTDPIAAGQARSLLVVL